MLHRKIYIPWYKLWHQYYEVRLCVHIFQIQTWIYMPLALVSKWNLLQKLYFLIFVNFQLCRNSGFGPYVSRYAWFEYEFLNRARWCTQYWPHFFMLILFKISFYYLPCYYCSYFLFYLNVQTYRVKELLMTG